MVLVVLIIMMVKSQTDVVSPVQYISFKAGRCDVADRGNRKFMVTPDRRKGLLVLTKNVRSSHRWHTDDDDDGVDDDDVPRETDKDRTGQKCEVQLT
jgi:hypothetical protein